MEQVAKNIVLKVGWGKVCPRGSLLLGDGAEKPKRKGISNVRARQCHVKGADVRSRQMMRWQLVAQRFDVTGHVGTVGKFLQAQCYVRSTQ
jgi:CxxC motif-containing protein